MDSLNRKSTMKSENSSKSKISDAANELLHESKKLVNEICEDGRVKINEAEQQLKEYSERFTKKIQEKPFTSLLIAGGIGFLLTKLIKK